MSGRLRPYLSFVLFGFMVPAFAPTFAQQSPVTSSADGNASKVAAPLDASLPDAPEAQQTQQTITGRIQSTPLN